MSAITTAAYCIFFNTSLRSSERFWYIWTASFIFLRTFSPVPFRLRSVSLNRVAVKPSSAPSACSERPCNFSQWRSTSFSLDEITGTSVLGRLRDFVIPISENVPPPSARAFKDTSNNLAVFVCAPSVDPFRTFAATTGSCVMGAVTTSIPMTSPVLKLFLGLAGWALWQDAQASWVISAVL